MVSRSAAGFQKESPTNSFAIAAALAGQSGIILPRTDQLPFRSKGARLSLIGVGTLLRSKVTRRLKLKAKFTRRNLPLPKVKMFARLQVQQN